MNKLSRLSPVLLLLIGGAIAQQGNGAVTHHKPTKVSQVVRRQTDRDAAQGRSAIKLGPNTIGETIAYTGRSHSILLAQV